MSQGTEKAVEEKDAGTKASHDVWTVREGFGTELEEKSERLYAEVVCDKIGD